MNNNSIIPFQGTASSRKLICPGIQLHPNRNHFKIQRAAASFWAALKRFGMHYCAFDCAMCKPEDNDDRSLSPSDYQPSFDKAHEVAEQLPDELYLQLLKFTNGRCPVCAVLSALQQFPRIAEVSEDPLFTWDSQPCHLTRRTTRTGYNYDDTARHVEALLTLDLDALPPFLTPAESHGLSTCIAPGKAVVSLVHDLKRNEMTEEQFQSKLAALIAFADSWNLNNVTTIVSSNAQATAYGGEGGKAAVTFEKDAITADSRIESGAVKMEANPTINVAAPDMKPIADMLAPLVARLAESEAGASESHNNQMPNSGGVGGDVDDPLPALDSRVSRSDIAAKLGKTTETLQGWEQKGLAPGGVVWPKAEVTKNNAFYNFREVWQPFLSLLPDKDRTQQVLLIEGLSITKRP